MAAAGRRVIVVGGGPAGLMAAEVLSRGGVEVELVDAMPSMGRKFLRAGIGGLNLTHAEPLEVFLSRYGARRPWIEPLLRDFGPEAVRDWARNLGVDTFVGSSGRVFPTGMKAAPLLRAWLSRLRQAGVSLRRGHRWIGWAEDGALRFTAADGEIRRHADAVVLALGGGSWPRLGSDGAWMSLLAARGIALAPLRAANCGFDTGWSDHFRGRFAGAPLKPVTLAFTDDSGERVCRQGELVCSSSGVEGSLIYAMSAPLRDRIAVQGHAVVELDLAPGRSLARLAEALSRPRGGRSMAKHLHSRAGIDGVKAALLRELAAAEAFVEPSSLAMAIKALPLRLSAPRPLAEAISSAGGVAFEALDPGLMATAAPGLFCAGEMLDWEAPTGGYLLTACLASGRAAGAGALAWLER